MFHVQRENLQKAQNLKDLFIQEIILLTSFRLYVNLDKNNSKKV